MSEQVQSTRKAAIGNLNAALDPGAFETRKILALVGIGHAILALMEELAKFDAVAVEERKP